MERGQKIKVKIEKLVQGGQGMARHGGAVVFVDNVIPGEEAEVLISDVKSGYASASLIGVTSASSDRIDPPCKYYLECGACQLQHMNYARQLKEKHAYFTETIERIAGPLVVQIDDVLPSGKEFGYRHKMQYPVRSGKSGKLLTGYFKKGSHDLISIERCPVLHPFLDKIASVFRSASEKARIPAYDEDRDRGLIRHLLSRISSANNEALLTLVARDRNIPGSKELVAGLTQIEQGEDGKLCGISKNINSRRTNVILGNENYDVWGRQYIKEKLLGNELRLSPVSFFQVNPVQAGAMFDIAVRLSGLAGKGTVFDIYCGIGSLTLGLARACDRVYGVESVPEAVSDANGNARLNGIKNAVFRRGLAEKEVPRLVDDGIRPDIVFLDPPRQGCDKKVLDAVMASGPAKIIYISCEPSTLARDIKLLAKQYSVERIVPVDMFPQTSHIESVTLLVRR